MKYKKKIRRLMSKQVAYDQMISKDPGLKYSYRRPGSVKKP